MLGDGFGTWAKRKISVQFEFETRLSSPPVTIVTELPGYLEVLRRVICWSDDCLLFARGRFRVVLSCPYVRFLLYRLYTYRQSVQWYGFHVWGAYHFRNCCLWDVTQCGFVYRYRRFGRSRWSILGSISETNKTVRRCAPLDRNIMSIRRYSLLCSQHSLRQSALHHYRR